MMWGSVDFEFAFKAAEGRSRMMLAIWDNNKLKMKWKIELN